MNKETLENIKNIIKEFINYLDSQGLELDENGDIVPKNTIKSLELKDEK